MKILFISHYYLPHIGGVEVHLENLNKELRLKNYEITTITTKHQQDLKSNEVMNGVVVYRITYPKIKILGLFTIWKEIIKLRKLIKDADIVHIHDVFIWYLPFRILNPKKVVYTTFHGGQDNWPVPKSQKYMVKMAEWLSSGTIAVGHFIEKHYGIKANYVIYGAVKNLNAKKLNTKLINRIVWIGRLDRNTDLPNFLKWLSTTHFSPSTIFLGDGEMRSECEKYGKVTGFVKDSGMYLKSAEIAVPVGYLSYLEAKKWGCKIMTFPSTPIKRDYWMGIEKLKVIPTWNEVIEVYIKLWGVPMY